MFEDYNEASEELRTRTSKILGGGVSEQMFLEEFVIPLNMQYSKGWWISLNRYDNSVLFFIVKNDLSAFDNEILHVLLENDQEVFQIVCLDDHYEIGSNNRFESIEDFLDDRGITIEGLPNRRRHNDEMLNRCIAYYNRIGMLTAEARSIRIEDTFLNRYFYTSNIDLFVKNPVTDKIACLEIKFKNQFQYKGQYVFGEDRLQYEVLFPIMRKCGFDVYNCVLFNHIKDNRNTEQTDIFNYIDNNHGLEYWKKKKFVAGEQHETYSFGVEHTAWRGNAGRSVYCIPLSQYSPINR